MVITTVMVLELAAAVAYVLLCWRSGLLYYPGELPGWFPRGAPPILAAGRRLLRLSMVITGITVMQIVVQTTNLAPILTQPLWRQILALAALIHLFLAPKLWLTLKRLMREARIMRIPLRIYYG